MPDESARWAIIVHGGAHEVPAEKASASRAGCLAALNAGRRVLEAGGTAVEAVESAIRVLEDDPTFNAGFGSALTSEGRVEMDAAIMDGATLDVGAVAGLTSARNPVSVAKQVLRERAILLIARGADAFARERGVELTDPVDLITSTQREAVEDHDTVGCVALDLHGHVAAGTSTGGLTGQRPGRVGDSPLPGCGFYADDTVGGVALTGEGESIARMMTAARIVHDMKERGPNAAVRGALEEMTRRVGGDGGGVALDKDGRVGWWHNSPHMPVAYQTSDTPEPRTFLTKEQEAEAHPLD
ncbi:isoaspartyl peptidase/L-asparaginase family protein [Deinococcus yavapaiensis]|uniref:Beta-aspartyl-peptidase (Threonine type) n=1 Tax=Deinococcus yavapaiensis KR-236 TaxID=694435 RepID=A0A318S5Y7_9DEIO|nr:isoaspartyl peptidase/L-asparaginase family protein [Deinococcus yavapaiensis]PYE53120.1 beta-aspartyl-peptidase (threonine type) [Deinococcus yavapaiensis KR-236]